MSRHDVSEGPGIPCDQCGGSGLGEKLPKRLKHSGLCITCDGIGFHGVDPYQVSDNLPGTTGRVGLMAARYREGLPIWNDEDRRGDSPAAAVVGLSDLSDQSDRFDQSDWDDDEFEDAA